MEVSLLVNDSASSALSIPEALRSPARRLAGASSSSCERSRPRDGVDFFAACLPPPPLGLDGCEASSAASWASRSAFLRAASAFLASASSLYHRQSLSLVHRPLGRSMVVPRVVSELVHTSSRCSWIPSATACLLRLLSSSHPLPFCSRLFRLSVPCSILAIIIVLNAGTNDFLLPAGAGFNQEKTKQSYNNKDKHTRA